MTTSFQIILTDERNWDYANQNKEQTIEQLKKDLCNAGYSDSMEVHCFYKGIALIWNCLSPFNKETNAIISKYCEYAYYMDENSSSLKLFAGWQIKSDNG